MNQSRIRSISIYRPFAEELETIKISISLASSSLLRGSGCQIPIGFGISRSIYCTGFQIVPGVRSVSSDGHGQGEGVQNVLYRHNEELSAVKFIGHWRSLHAASSVQVPEGFAGGWIEGQQVARVICAEKKMSRGR